MIHLDRGPIYASKSPSALVLDVLHQPRFHATLTGYRHIAFTLLRFIYLFIQCTDQHRRTVIMCLRNNQCIRSVFGQSCRLADTR